MTRLVTALLVIAFLAMACSGSTVTIAGASGDSESPTPVGDDSAPTELELRCPGSVESSIIDRFGWSDTGPDSAEEAIASYPVEAAFRPDWAVLELADVSQSGSSANGWFVDDDHIVRLIVRSEARDDVWLVTGWSSCSPG